MAENSDLQIEFEKRKDSQKDEILYHFQQEQSQKTQQHQQPNTMIEENYYPHLVTQKYEFFKSQNLLILMQMSGRQEYRSKPKTQYLYDNLKHYYHSSDFLSQRAHVIYKYSKRQAEDETGRLYSWTRSLYHKDKTQMVALQSFPRWVRAALAAEYYFDVDIVNAHPTMLLSVLKILFPEKYNNHSFKNLLYYCHNRDTVLNLMSQFLGNGPIILENEEARKAAKKFITSLFFGAQVPTMAGVDIRFKFIQGYFHLDGLVKELKEIGQCLFELVQNGLIKDGDEKNPQNSSYQIIMLSLVQSYKFLDAEWKKQSKASQNIPQNEPSQQLEVQLQKEEQANEGQHSIAKKRSSFLAFLLQDLERKVMHEFEKALMESDSGRKIDVYIHDGCLIRKLCLSTSTSTKKTKKYLEWDHETLATKKNSIKFEQIWTDHQLIEHAQDKIMMMLGLDLKFVVKSLDTTEFDTRLESLQLTYLKDALLNPPLKTFEELFYHYETTRSLCYITERNKFLLGTELIPKEQLKDAIDEPYFKSIKYDQFGGNPKDIEVNFYETYMKRADRARYDRIELVRTHFINHSKQQRLDFSGAFNQSPGANPYKVLGSIKSGEGGNKGGKTAKSLYLLDLNEGWPLLTDDNQINGSLENLEEFRNYISSQRTYQYSPNHITANPLFPLELFEEGQLLAKYPLAVPYFNHWYILLGKDDGIFEYVVQWIAKIAKTPGDMSNICGLVFYSQEQGIGKSLAIKMTMSLFAPFTQETQSVERIFDKFSDLMEFVILLHIEDAPPQQLGKFQNELKGRMTAEKLFIEKKNHPIYSVTNFCRVMLSTNEERSLILTPEDRRWAAFECSSLLKGKKGYFKDLARYWRLHQSKTDVLNTLMGIGTKSNNPYDAEQQRPITPYIYKLMHWSKFNHNYHKNHKILTVPGKFDMKIYQGNDMTQYYDNQINSLLSLFLDGLNTYLKQTPLNKVKFSISIRDLFYEKSKYWIKVTLLPELYYIWAYGTNNCAFTLILWKKLAIPTEHRKMLTSFKQMMNILAPDLKPVCFNSKQKCLFYPIDLSNVEKKRQQQKCYPHIIEASGGENYEVGEGSDGFMFLAEGETIVVDLISLYQNRKLFWKDLGQNLPEFQESSRKKKTNSQINKQEEMMILNEPSLPASIQQQQIEKEDDNGIIFPYHQDMFPGEEEKESYFEIFDRHKNNSEQPLQIQSEQNGAHAVFDGREEGREEDSMNFDNFEIILKNLAEEKHRYPQSNSIGENSLSRFL